MIQLLSDSLLNPRDATAVKSPLVAVADRSQGLAWQRRYVIALTVSDVVVVGAAMACAQMVRLGGRPVTQFDPLTIYFGLLSVIFG